MASGPRQGGRAWARRTDLPAASEAFAAATENLYRRSIEHREPESGLGAVVFSLRALGARIDEVTQ